MIMSVPHAYARLPTSASAFFQLADCGNHLRESAFASILGAVVGLLLGTAFLFGLRHVPALHGYVDISIEPYVLFAVVLGHSGAHGRNVRSLAVLWFSEGLVTMCPRPGNFVHSGHRMIWKAANDVDVNLNLFGKLSN